LTTDSCRQKPIRAPPSPTERVYPTANHQLSGCDYAADGRATLAGTARLSEQSIRLAEAGANTIIE
jgi:hypothetical protein